jgi:hypothetical protein
VSLCLALGARLLDERGASANCSSLVRESVQLVLARAEGEFNKIYYAFIHGHVDSVPM